MSNSKSHIQTSHQNKLIRIKPIEFIKQEQIEQENKLSLNDENFIIQNELQNAKIELESLKQQKETMLQNAIADIKSVKESWDIEKQQLIKQAYEEGRSAGLIIGKKDAMEQYKQLIDRANNIVESAKKDYHTTIEQADKMIVQLAIHIAEKIMKKKISDDPTSFLAIVAAAIKEIKDQSVISIFLHPDNYEFILKQKNELKNSLDRDTEISIYIDQEMVKGDCLIEHPFGQIDASIDTQLQQIRSVLSNIMMENKS